MKIIIFKNCYKLAIDEICIYIINSYGYDNYKSKSFKI